MALVRTPIPFFDLSKEYYCQGLEWGQLCLQVRQGFEKHGCVLVRYDAVPAPLRAEMFAAMVEFFSLPAHTKRQLAKPDDHLFSYIEPTDRSLYYESVAVINSVEPTHAQAFTKLLWPQEIKEPFCETIVSTSTKMMEVSQMIMRMIFDSYGVGRLRDYYTRNVDSYLRMIKYSAPMSDETVPGLLPHVDGNFVSVLFQNEVDGLELKSSDGNWLNVDLMKDTFVVFAGHALQAWSNGRIVAPTHKVTFKGDKDRLTCGFFVLPKADDVIEPPPELVDEEHPSRYKSFKYKDFLGFYFVKEGAEDSLDKFAGI